MMTSIPCSIDGAIALLRGRGVVNVVTVKSATKKS